MGSVQSSVISSAPTIDNQDLRPALRKTPLRHTGCVVFSIAHPITIHVPPARVGRAGASCPTAERAMWLQKQYAGRRDCIQRLLLEPFLSRAEKDLINRPNDNDLSSDPFTIATNKSDFLSHLTPPPAPPRPPAAPTYTPVHPGHYSLCIAAATDEMDTVVVPQYVALPLLSATARSADSAAGEHLLQQLDDGFAAALARFVALHSHPTAGSPRVRACGALTAALWLLVLIAHHGSGIAAVAPLYKSARVILLPPCEKPRNVALVHLRGLCCSDPSTLVAWCTALYYAGSRTGADPKATALVLCSTLCDRHPLRFIRNGDCVMPRTLVALTVAFLLAEVPAARSHRIRSHFRAIQPVMDFATAALSMSNTIVPKLVAAVRAEVAVETKNGLFAALLRSYRAPDWSLILDTLLQQPEPQRWCDCSGSCTFS